MPKELTDEQIIKILEKLPEDLKDALFSIDTAERIADVCEKFEVPGKKVPLVAGAVGDILLRTELPEGLSKTLEKEVGLKREQAESIAKEIDFRIFSQVRASLSEPLGVPQIKTAAETISKPGSEKPTTAVPPKSDTYREPTA